MQPALTVIGMRKAAGTGIDSGDTLIVGGVGVTDAGHHALGVQSSRVDGGAAALVRLGDSSAGVLDLFDAIGERRGQPAGGTATGELG